MIGKVEETFTLAQVQAMIAEAVAEARAAANSPKAFVARWLDSEGQPTELAKAEYVGIYIPADELRENVYVNKAGKRRLQLLSFANAGSGATLLQENGEPFSFGEEALSAKVSIYGTEYRK